MQIAVLLLFDYLVDIVLPGNIFYKGVRNVAIEVSVLSPG